MVTRACARKRSNGSRIGSKAIRRGRGPEQARQFRHPASIAIAAGLAAPAPDSVTYTLTGDTARTTDEIAALASEVTGKPLAVVHLSDEQLSQGMAAAGVPAPFIPTLVSFDANTREGKIDMVTDDAATLSGKKPTPLKAFLDASKPALLG